jgi:hypothetical protein
MRFNNFSSRIDFAYNASLDVLEILDQNEDFRAESKLLRRRLGRAYRVLMADPENETARERYRTMFFAVKYYMDIACEEN